MIMIKLMISLMEKKTKREIGNSSEEEKENSEILTIKIIIGITSSESLIGTREVEIKKILKDQEK
jgi:hypothetical protein